MYECVCVRGSKGPERGKKDHGRAMAAVLRIYSDICLIFTEKLKNLLIRAAGRENLPRCTARNENPSQSRFQTLDLLVTVAAKNATIFLSIFNQ